MNSTPERLQQVVKKVPLYEAKSDFAYGQLQPFIVRLAVLQHNHQKYDP
jgi:hypothetical protein